MVSTVFMTSPKHVLNYENAMRMSTFIITQSDNARAMSELCRIVYKFLHVHYSGLKVNWVSINVSFSIRELNSSSIAVFHSVSCGEFTASE